MARGVPHPPELRAQVLAAIMAGTTISQAARDFGLDHGLVSRWVTAGVQPIAPEKRQRTDVELIMTYFRTALEAMITQAQVFGDPAYCRGQDADKLGIAHGILGDKLAGVAATAQTLGLIGPEHAALGPGADDLDALA